MITRTISFSELVTLGRWRADLHVHDDNRKVDTTFKVCKLGAVVAFSKEAVLPSSLPQERITYIGLENVEPVTGDLVACYPISPSTIRSRSKIFKSGNILYGKLRPALRKVLLVPDELNSGICSNEFIVIKAIESRIVPLFLRELLASEPVSRKLERMQGGAALPRVSPNDLLNLEIPLPPLQEQKRICIILESLRKERELLQNRLAAISTDQQEVMQPVFD